MNLEYVVLLLVIFIAIMLWKIHYYFDGIKGNILEIHRVNRILMSRLLVYEVEGQTRFGKKSIRTDAIDDVNIVNEYKKTKDLS